MSSFQSAMRSLLTRKIKPNMFPRPFLILGLALLPASLANGQLSVKLEGSGVLLFDFVKDELLDSVITLKAHPFDKYGAYPPGLADSLNVIDKLKQTSDNAILRLRVTELCQRPEYLQWFERRLEEVWQQKDGKIDELMAVEQSLQIESDNLSKQMFNLVKRFSGLESTNQSLSASVSALESKNQSLSDSFSGLESTNQSLSASVSELESKNQVLSAKVEGKSSFSWLGILLIIVLSLLLLGALGWWWLQKSKGKGGSSEELARENNMLKQENKRLKQQGESQATNSFLDAKKWSQLEDDLVEAKAKNNRLTIENIRLQNS